MKIETIEKAINAFDTESSTNWSFVRDVTSKILRNRKANIDYYVRATNSKNGDVEVVIYHKSNDRKYFATVFVCSNKRRIKDHVRSLLEQFGYSFN